MKKLIVSVITFGMSVAALAALPPQYESSKQIAAVATSAEVTKQFNGWIDSVTYQRVEGGQAYWLVASGKCNVRVDVTCRKMPPGFAGPCQHILKVGKKQCLPDLEN